MVTCFHSKETIGTKYKWLLIFTDMSLKPLTVMSTESKNTFIFYLKASGDADVSPSDLSWGLLLSLISDQAAITGLEDLAMTDEIASLLASLS